MYELQTIATNSCQTNAIKADMPSAAIQGINSHQTVVNSGYLLKLYSCALLLCPHSDIFSTSLPRIPVLGFVQKENTVVQSSANGTAFCCPLSMTEQLFRVQTSNNKM